MSAVLGLGLQLARAGGPLRAWSIAAGNAIGVLLLLTALSLPSALYVGAVDRAMARIELAGILLFLLVPATILLVTAGRLSSGVRDRRLAALRMIGVPPHRTRQVAAVENGSLALAGAAGGAVLFAGVAPLMSRVVVDGPGWFSAPLRTTPGAVVGVVLAVTALSVLVGTAATWERALPGAARSESTRQAPGAWRLVVLAAGLALLGRLAFLDPMATNSGLLSFLLLGGATATAVGIALVTPLLTDRVAGRLVRSRSSAAVLAGRTIQTDAAGASRVVAGLGVAVFLVVGALGVLGAVQNTPQYLYAQQMVTDGPQKMWLTASGSDAYDEQAVLDAADLDELLQVPGVHGAVPSSYGAQVDCAGPEDEPDDGMWCQPVFVGTCAQLALTRSVTGCDDAHAARIVPDVSGVRGAGYFALPEPVTGNEVTLVLPTADGGPARVTLPLAEEPVVEDMAETVRTWVYATGDSVFVPIGLVHDVVGAPSSADVIAEAGTDVQESVAAWAQQHGYHAEPYPTSDLEDALAVRAAVWTLSGIALGVGLLVLALTAADRAAERRHTVARQVMVGVPARVLRTSQLLQVLVPLSAALVLSVGSGLVLLQAYARMAEITTFDVVTDSELARAVAQFRQLVDGGSWTALGVVVLAGGLLVALSTVPLIRTRLSPELLRRE